MQEEVRTLFGSDDAATTITLPDTPYGDPFDIPTLARSTQMVHSGRTVPLFANNAHPFSHANGESRRIINGESITLVEPVRAKTVTLWYEGIWAEALTTDADKEAVTISHGDFSKTEIPPHGANQFFIEVKKPEIDQHPIEWDIGDTHQGVIIRTDQESPIVTISMTPADDRDIFWSEYAARVWVEHGEFEIKDVGFHVWRNDGAAMNLEEVQLIQRAISHGLSFTSSTWCRPKVAIAWKETWSDNQWWGTWTPLWGAWEPTSPAKKNRTKNWMPMGVRLEKVLEEILRNIGEDHYPVIARYVHNTTARDNGDWMSSVTASVAILQRIAIEAGFDREKCGPELWKQISAYLRSKEIERPYYYVGWGEEAKRLIEDGKQHDNLVQEIAKLRNQVTAHWLKDGPPLNAAWLAQQAIYYVETAMRAELAPTVPMWDRTRAFHHPPIPDSSGRNEG